MLCSILLVVNLWVHTVHNHLAWDPVVLAPPTSFPLGGTWCTRFPLNDVFIINEAHSHLQYLYQHTVLIHHGGKIIFTPTVH